MGAQGGFHGREGGGVLAASGAGWSPEPSRVTPKLDVGSWHPGSVTPFLPYQLPAEGKGKWGDGVRLSWMSLGSQESPECSDAAEGCIDINTNLYKYIQKLGLVILVGLFQVRAFSDSIQLHLYV